MLDRTDSSFDYAAVESASSQQNRLARVSISSAQSDQTEINLHSRASMSSPTDRTSNESQLFKGKR